VYFPGITTSSASSGLTKISLVSLFGHKKQEDGKFLISVNFKGLVSNIQVALISSASLQS
jgi:hypothetical protein